MLHWLLFEFMIIADFQSGVILLILISGAFVKVVMTMVNIL